MPRDRFVLQGRCPTGRVVRVREVAGANVGLGPERGASQDLVCAPDQLRSSSLLPAISEAPVYIIETKLYIRESVYINAIRASLLPAI